jgi:Tol biopolymer transport system component
LFNFKTHQLSQLPDSQGIFGPRWSPDGRYIVAITQATKDRRVLYGLRTQRWRQLETAVHGFGYLTWSSDDTSLNFDTLESGASAFYRLRISDSKLEKLVDLNKVRRFSDQFGGGSSWTALGPGDVLLLARDISTQEIYASDLQLP